MANKEGIVKATVDQIFLLEEPPIAPEREEKISEFINLAVNGDTPISSLVINALINQLSPGAIAYILTDYRLIKIDITELEINSHSYPLNTLIGINRRLNEANEIELNIAFRNGKFTLQYIEDEASADFFQKLELLSKSQEEES